MQRYWLFQFVLITAMLLPLAGQINASETATGGPYAHLEKMDADTRTAWVDTMLKRLDEANRVVLSAKATAKQHSRFEEMLVSFVKGRVGWQSQVAKFEEELVLSQRAATEHLIRRYRMDTYRAFRGNRTAFEKHRSLLEQLLGNWQDSKSPSSQRHKVVQWLIAATRDPDGLNVGQLPPLPKFEGKGRSSSTKRILAQSDLLEPRRIPPTPSTARMLLPSTLSEVELPSTTAPSKPEISLHGPRPAAFLASRITTSIDSNTVRPVAFYSPPRVELPLAVHRSTPRPHHIAMLPSLEPSGFAETLKPKMVAYSSTKTTRRPTSVASVTRPTTRTQPRIANRSAASPSQTRDPLAFARTKVDRLTMVSTQQRYESPRESNNVALNTAPAKQDSLRPVTYVQGNTSSPRSYGTTNSSKGGKLTSPAPRTGGSTNQIASNQPSTTTATPNMDELAARIRGNNVALQKLAAQLYEERGWDAESLNTILEQLEPLVARKDDLKLIRELIPADQRDRVGDLETGSDLISGLGSKIARVRTQLEQDQQSENAAARKQELKRLDQLSQKLANLVFSN